MMKIIYTTINEIQKKRVKVSVPTKNLGVSQFDINSLGLDPREKIKEKESQDTVIREYSSS